MALEFEKDDEVLHVQLWSTNLSMDWKDSNFVLFENDFGFSLKKRILQIISDFPHSLRTSLRPIDFNTKSKMCHQ